MTPEYRIAAGFMPLTDSLLLVVAKVHGFAAAEGIDLTLIRETSWANIRDRVAVGQFDVAHMLAPMPLAAMLGLTPIGGPVIAPMALGLGGNAVTVSPLLWEKMRAAGAPDDLAPGPVGQALAAVIEGTERRLRFAVVHTHSGHNYELRYWLAASGIDPDRAVEIVVLPPPLMPDAIRTGGIDGYCVGEPWNSVAATAGTGHIATVKAAIWPRSPEKVLGTTLGWAERNPAALTALIRALERAAEWCGDAGNHPEVAALLARPEFLGIPADVVARALSSQIAPEFFTPYAHRATYPCPTHGLWFYSQMVRWGDVQHTEHNAELARTTFRPDLYRAALGMAELPPAKIAFFDDHPFDPADLNGYIASQRPYA